MGAVSARPAPSVSAPAATSSHLQWIKASVGPSLRLIPVADVAYLRSDEKYTLVATKDFDTLIRTPIKEILEGLDGNKFWQIHRSTLVNVKAIAGITRDFRGRQIVAVKGHKEQLEVSRSYLGLFKGM